MRKVYMNGSIVDEAEAKLSVYDSALMFGDMVFEMTRSFGKKQFKLEAPVKKDVNTSKIWNLASSYGLFCKEEGYKICEDGNHTPQIRICGDIDTLDAFLEYARIILNDYDKEQKGELELRPGEPGYVAPEVQVEEPVSEDVITPDESYLQNLVDEIDL